MSNNNFNHLELLYKKALNLNIQIEKYIENETFDKIDDSLKIKVGVLKDILRCEKTFKGTDQEEQKRLELRQEVEDLEKKNLESMQNIHGELKQEIHKIKKGKKITQAYMSRTTETRSTINVVE